MGFDQSMPYADVDVNVVVVVVVVGVVVVDVIVLSTGRTCGAFLDLTCCFGYIVVVVV